MKLENKKQDEVETPLSKAEPKLPDPPRESVTTNILVSDMDAYLLDRQKSQPKSLDEVDIQVFEKPAQGRHQLSLPVELEAYEKKYAFCWIYKKKRSIDEAMNIYHWVMVNRTLFPDLPKHLFTSNGAIEQGDEILMFRSKSVDEEMRKAPGLESTRNLKARTEAHKDDPAFYIPKSDEYEVGPDGKRRLVPVVGV